MKSLSSLVAVVLVACSLSAAEPAPKPKARITPGKVIVPTGPGEMRRPWGELVSMDLATRTGTFRRDGSDEIIKFTVMPYSELLHHAAFGDLQDFRIGERAIFRLHENEAGEWNQLTYIQDEMNFLKNHGERYQVESIDASDAAAGSWTVTQGNWEDPKKDPFIRTKGIVIKTDADTRYWKQGAPAKFADVQVGDRIRTKTRGTGQGSDRVCWEVFLDDESLLKFQAEQKAVHAARLEADGAPGYVDTFTKSEVVPLVELTLFQEGGDIARALKQGQKVSVVGCGVDRKPSGKPAEGVVAEVKMQGNLGKATVKLDDLEAGGVTVGGLVRLKPVK
jgi:hypothetical protein